jgi:hypothetical protein
MSSDTVTVNGEHFWQTSGKGLLTKKEVLILRHRAGELREATAKLELGKKFLTAVYPAKLYVFMYLNRARRAVKRQIDRTPMYLWALSLLVLAYAGQVAATAVRGWGWARSQALKASTYLSSEGFHKVTRKHSITAMYLMGALLMAGTLPKLLIAVWTL